MAALTNDPVERKFLDIQYYVGLIKSGHIRLLFIGGPPGIGKTRQVLVELEEYAHEVEVAWANATDREKRSELKRRTRSGENGLEFVSPVRIIAGGDLRTNEANLYGHLWHCSYPGEIGILDDAHAIRYKRSQELLNDAVDEERGEISIGRKIEGIPSSFRFRGALIVIHNWTREEVIKHFHQRVRSRAQFVYLPTKPEELFNFVFRTAIKEKSLMPYLTALNNPALGSRRGLGLSKTQAEQVLHDVAKFYFTYQDRVNEHSFRLLRSWALLRATEPAEWERRAREKFIKNES